VGLDREGGLINSPPVKRGGLLERGGAYLKGRGLNRGFTVSMVSLVKQPIVYIQVI